MKTNEEIIQHIQSRQWDSARYASLDRLHSNPIDAPAWTYLGHAMMGLGRGRMAIQCLQRAKWLAPAAQDIDTLFPLAATVEPGRDDAKVMKLLTIPHTTVSVCILTHNSERTINDCIQSLHDTVDEWIVVDTGSTDNTLEQLASLGIQATTFPWQEDFSAARNYATSLATMDWVIHIDSDEMLFSEDRNLLRQMAGIYSQVEQPIILHLLQMNHAHEQSYEAELVPRMFPRNQAITWHGRVHEYPMPSEGIPLTLLAPIRIRHDGYNATQFDTAAKYHRNLALLKQDLKHNKKDPRILFFLGREHVLLGEYEQAVKYLKKAETVAKSTDHTFLNAISDLSNRIHSLQHSNQ